MKVKNDTSEELRFITIESRSFGNNTKIMLEPRLSRPRLEAPFIKPTAQVIDCFRGLTTYRVMLALFVFGSNKPTCPVFFTIMLSLCLSPTPRTYVATQYPTQESVNRRTASAKLQIEETTKLTVTIQVCKQKKEKGKKNSQSVKAHQCKLANSDSKT